MKDYYKILNVKPTAPAGEIKSTYRKLAMKYHPDRNPDDSLAAAVFTELAEAYKILSDADARRQYNYERAITATQEFEKPTETIESLIEQAQKISRYVKTQDPFRFNKDALLYSLTQLFPQDVSALLHTNSDQLTQFLETVCDSCEWLSCYQTKQLMQLLQPLYSEYPWLQQRLSNIAQRQQKAERWEKNKIILAIVIALMLCIIIFFAAGK